MRRIIREWLETEKQKERARDKEKEKDRQKQRKKPVKSSKMSKVDQMTKKKVRWKRAVWKIWGAIIW